MRKNKKVYPQVKTSKERKRSLKFLHWQILMIKLIKNRQRRNSKISKVTGSILLKRNNNKKASISRKRNSKARIWTAVSCRSL